MSDGLYVHFGCGLEAPAGWLNFDASPTLRFERSILGFLYQRNDERFPANVRYGDVVRGLPVKDGSVRGLYCQHVLEHLALDECDTALANCRRYLEPRGIFRMVVPDFAIYIDEYVKDKSDNAAFVFLQSSALGRERRARGLKGLLREWLGNSAHLWMWDERSLAARLRQHGFVDIRRAECGDAEDPKFKEVENPPRFIDSLCMECRG